MSTQAWPNYLSLSVISSHGHGDEERRRGGARESERAKRRPSACRECAPSTLQGKSISQRVGFGSEGKVGNDVVKPSELLQNIAENPDAWQGCVFGTKTQGPTTERQCWNQRRKEEGACPGESWGLNGKVGHVCVGFC